LDTLTPIINSLNNNNIIYYKDRGVYEDENISWCVYSQFQNNIPPDINTATGVKIGLFHGPIQGMTTDLGFDFGDHAYDIDKFNGLDVCLCGDIHKRQEFNFSTGKGYMIGSTLQNNNIEINDTIKFNLVSVSGSVTQLSIQMEIFK
jgi:DNA repair exonuclease SbcCD nuclease subunit